VFNLEGLFDTLDLSKVQRLIMIELLVASTIDVMAQSDRCCTLHELCERNCEVADQQLHGPLSLVPVSLSSISRTQIALKCKFCSVVRTMNVY
jgi:hypothetical protein